MQTVACQTTTTELADVRTLEQSLYDVRSELDKVNDELGRAERRLRLEVREEMETRVKKFERKTHDKVAFLRQRQESSVNTMRKASRAKLESEKAQVEHELKVEYESREAVHQQQIETMRADIEQKALLIAGYERENRQLRAKNESLSAASMAAYPKKSGKELDVTEQTAQLEASLAQRDATIRALREQLARLQHGLPAGADAAPSLGASKSTPAIGRTA
jgi:predicted RNA-binding Zn ribbon-like protein